MKYYIWVWDNERYIDLKAKGYDDQKEWEEALRQVVLENDLTDRNVIQGFEIDTDTGECLPMYVSGIAINMINADFPDWCGTCQHTHGECGYGEYWDALDGHPECEGWEKKEKEATR